MEIQCPLRGIYRKENLNADKFRVLCDKVASISDDYKVLLLDASSVTENDIALYFTRIGKGGVVPSDEELAYSVLKSKLNADFRDVIQDVHLKHGLASEPRIAHLAIRLFKSGKDRFYSGSVFSAVMEMCKTENASDKQLFYDFIKNDFRAIVDKVEEKYQLTQWHSARYASERNGDAFLLLLLAVNENGLFDGYNIKSLKFTFDECEVDGEELEDDDKEKFVKGLTHDWEWDQAATDDKNEDSSSDSKSDKKE